MNLEKFPILPVDKTIDIVIPKDLYQKTDIIDLPKFSAHIIITKDINQDYYLQLTAESYMVLQDCLTLEEVKYPFTINIEEKIDYDNEILANFMGNCQNTLDIIGVLWENIILEMPISFSLHELKDEIHDNWELVGEKKSDEIDARLAPLMELLDKEKE